MKNTKLPVTFLLFLLLSFTLSGCDVILGIFEAGFWIGIILVVLVAGLIWYFTRGRRGGGTRR